MATKTTARKAAPKAALAKKVEITETETVAPEKNAKSSHGIQYLVEQVKAQTGKDTTGYALRIILRKLIAEGTLQRGEGRYTFSGPEDPQVAAVVEYIKSGREEADKKAKTTKAKGAKKTMAPPEPVEEVDLDDELDEEEVDLEAGFDDEEAAPAEEDAEDETDLFEDEDEDDA